MNHVIKSECRPKKHAPPGYRFLVQVTDEVDIKTADEAIAWAKRVFSKEDVVAAPGHYISCDIHGRDGFTKDGWMLFCLKNARVALMNKHCQELADELLPLDWMLPTNHMAAPSSKP